MASGHASPEAVIATKIVFTITAGLLTIARLYTRTSVVRNAGMDDVFITLGLIGSVILTVTTWEQVRYGTGKRVDTLDPEDAPHSLLWLWVAIIFYNISLGCVKLSILLQYLRILPAGVKDGPEDERCPRNKYRIATFVMIAVVLVFSTWAVLSAIFTCSPVQKFWYREYSGTCLPEQTIWFINAGINIATEVCTVVLPLPVVYSLGIPQRQKHILMFVFGIAGITVVISILRLPFLYIFTLSDDVTWDNPMVSIASSLELNIAIMASCIPTLRGLLLRLFPSFSSSENAFSHMGNDNNRQTFDEGCMEDLEGIGRHGNRYNSQSSANTTTHLNSTCFNTTARLDDVTDGQ